MQEDKNDSTEANDPAMASLDITIINDMIENIESLEKKCKAKKGEDVIEMRTRQLCLSKILVNVYEKDIFHLIKGFTLLGISYIDIGFFEQAQEHLLSAFKLIENLTDAKNIFLKEYQIKILINLSKCYLENGKANAALSISEKCLKINETLLGENHITNADILFVLVRVNFL
jgi:tetratricopeptide (TPR) repeat protein